MCPNHIKCCCLRFRRVCPVYRSMLVMEVRGLDARDGVIGGCSLLELPPQLQSQRGQQRALCAGEEKHYLLPLPPGCHGGSGQSAATATSRQLLSRFFFVYTHKKNIFSNFKIFNFELENIILLLLLVPLLFQNLQFLKSSSYVTSQSALTPLPG